MLMANTFPALISGTGLGPAWGGGGTGLGPSPKLLRGGLGSEVEKLGSEVEKLGSEVDKLGSEVGTELGSDGEREEAESGKGGKRRGARKMERAKRE